MPVESTEMSVPYKKQAFFFGIRPCHTAAILSRETKRPLFYHAKPRSGNHGGEAWRGKTKHFGLPGQCGRRVTRANGTYRRTKTFTHVLTEFLNKREKCNTSGHRTGASYQTSRPGILARAIPFGRS